jgi:hypothetical protein
MSHVIAVNFAPSGANVRFAQVKVLTKALNSVKDVSEL